MVIDILENVGFYDNIPKIELKSVRMKCVLYNLPKALAKLRNPHLPKTENAEPSSDLQGEELKKK